MAADAKLFLLVIKKYNLKQKNFQEFKEMKKPSSSLATRPP